MTKTVKCPRCNGAGAQFCGFCFGAGRLSREQLVEEIEKAEKNAAKWAESARVMKQALAAADARSAKMAPKHQYRLACPRCRYEWIQVRKPKPSYCGPCFKSFAEAEAAGGLLTVERVELVAVQRLETPAEPDRIIRVQIEDASEPERVVHVQIGN